RRVRTYTFTPHEFFGTVLDLATKRRGSLLEQEYPAPKRVVLSFDIPLAELIVDFYDQLKSRTRGYASLDYQFSGYRPEALVKLEILIHEEPGDAVAMCGSRRDA